MSTTNPFLTDELISLNAIFGPDTLVLQPPSSEPLSDIAILTLPLPTSTPSSSSGLSFLLAFPPTYPSSPPVVERTHSTGSDTTWKGRGEQACHVLRDVVNRVFVTGQVCLFDLVESSLPILGSRKDQEQHEGDEEEPEEQVQVSPAPNWVLSEVLTVKKSSFVAHAVPVGSTEEARSYITHLLSTDKKVGGATHNVTAYRIKTIKGGREVVQEDYDDDGETAAGARLLHLMQLMGSLNVLLVVSRWFGGIKLGSDRFRYINEVAKEVLVQGGWGRKTDQK